MTERNFDPYTFPGVDVDKLKGKSPGEQDAFVAAERAEWERRRPLEIARRDKRAATIAAGGDAAGFDKWWKESGEAATVREMANRRQEYAAQDTVF